MASAPTGCPTPIVSGLWESTAVRSKISATVAEAVVVGIISYEWSDHHVRDHLGTITRIAAGKS